MRTNTANRWMATALRRSAVPVLTLGLLVGAGAPSALADTASTHRSVRAGTVVTLPNATGAEGIAAGEGTTFYAGDLYTGDIFRGDIRRGTAEKFIDAPEGRLAFGMKVDVRHHLLFVAGASTGQAYVYDTRTGATVATYQLGTGGALGTPGISVINDVALAPKGAWFTDSNRSRLYFVPVSSKGALGRARTLDVSGPAADLTGAFNLNGIQASQDGRTLIVAHTQNQRIYRVNAKTGASTLIEGVTTPNADGIVLRDHTLWVNENFNNQIARIHLSKNFGTATQEKLITSPAFGVPTTSALFGEQLAAVNGHFDLGFPAPPGTAFQAVVVNA